MVSDSFTESVILEVKSVGVLDPGQVIQTYQFTGDLWSCVVMVPWLENIGVWQLAGHCMLRGFLCSQLMWMIYVHPAILPVVFGNLIEVADYPTGRFLH